MHQSLMQAYGEKIPDYFQGSREDIIDDLPPVSGLKILEIGCGTGATLQLAKLRGKASHVTGIEINPISAAVAKTVLDETIEGNIEDLQLPFADQSFDAVIISEVLEHLIDPWAALKRIYPLIKVGGLLYASSPNVAHMSVLKMLLRNRWDYADSGVLDWTHVRWFTTETYQEMIESSGFCVIWNKAVAQMTNKQSIANMMTFGIFRHLFTSQVFIKAMRMRP